MVIKKINELWISKAFVNKLYDWVEENEPYEACAMLVGTIKQRIAIVEEVVLMENIRKSTGSFEMNPESMLKVYQDAEEKNQELVSIFHSHPGGSYPSGVDRHNMEHLNNFKAFKNLIWTIMDAGNNDLNGFIYFNEELLQVDVQINKE